MSDTGFSNSSGTGGNPGRDYLSVSTDMNQQLTGDTRNFGGGVGDRTQGSGRFGATNIQQPSQGDQYGSSGGYSGKSLSAEPDTSGIQTQDTRGQGDMVDKGIDYLEKKLGHEQSHATTEKISDGVRTGFNKLTGKNIPIEDKEYK